MARSTKTLTIGKSEYKLTQLGATKGAELWLDLLHVIASPIEEVAKAGDLDESVLVRAITAAVRSLDHATTNRFYAAFGPLTSVLVPARSPGDQDRWPTLEGAVFDDHFAGQYIALTEWLVQSILFNFFGFLGDGSLGSLVERFQAMTAAATTGSSTT